MINFIENFHKDLFKIQLLAVVNILQVFNSWLKDVLF